MGGQRSPLTKIQVRTRVCLLRGGHLQALLHALGQGFGAITRRHGQQLHLRPEDQRARVREHLGRCWGGKERCLECVQWILVALAMHVPQQGCHSQRGRQKVRILMCPPSSSSFPLPPLSFPCRRPTFDPSPPSPLSLTCPLVSLLLPSTLLKDPPARRYALVSSSHGWPTHRSLARHVLFLLF